MGTSNISQWVFFDWTKDVKAPWNRQHRSKLKFWDKACFVLFTSVYGHSETSVPKVSWSIILILQCKQTGHILSRCIPDTEISSLSAVDKNMCLGHWLLNPFFNRYKPPPVQQTAEKRMVPVKLCILQNPAVSWKNLCEAFRAELNQAEWDNELWCWWWCVALSYSNSCFTKTT